MRVKIGDKILNPNDEPIMIILSDQDKKNIADMPKEAHCYCEYPHSEHWTENDYFNVRQFMYIDEDVLKDLMGDK